MAGFASQKYKEIVTCDEDPSNSLRKPAQLISKENWHLARSIAQKLIDVREHILKGGAGLAAPQIGLSYAIFIYTPDRTTENLRVVINPSFKPLGSSLIKGEEACFSVPLRCTQIQRWEKIKVSYQNLEGHFVEEILQGFAAKVFQHEMDHLQGKLTIDHENAEVITFSDAASFQAHMQQVHLEDAKRYGEG